jgi:prepilin peptidase CpaA
MISDPAFWFLLTALPFCIWAAFSDLKTMTIPNRLSIWMVAAFLIPGFIFLEPITLLWHLVAAAVVLVIGFLMNAMRLMGGGDAKFGAAMAPYVFIDTIDQFMLTLGIFLFAALLSHRIAGRIPALKQLAPDWVSWSTGRNFPMGYAMAGALVCYQLNLLFNFLTF